MRAPEQGYKITPAQLEAAITPQTRLFILNSPCNPTGAAYTRAELRALGDVLRRAPARRRSAPTTCTSTSTGPASRSAASLTAVPGALRPHGDDQWRVEELRDDRLAHRLLRRAGEIVDAMSTIQGQSTSNPSSISQKARSPR